MAKTKRPTQDEIYSIALFAIGILIVGFILVFIFTIVIRLQRGLLGFILAGATVVLLVYWLIEIRNTVRREMEPPIASRQKAWIYDLIDTEEGMTFVAEVPGPEDQVKVQLTEQILKIQGGQQFLKEVRLPKEAQIVESHYVNGVLNVKLKKL